LLCPVPSGIIVVVGWMIVPLAERSTTCCGAGGCRFPQYQPSRGSYRLPSHYRY
jgi:hypothetical protein